ncbi:zinc ABC transporter substrate-binding protein [Jiella sp. MQZ9-1]|uniref:Zinc ABC transporter substrate-binding protein n=1 Tax=Jiella flava TaxID=2816857 RepID=A0A939JV10_9HYPH|nr:zinc ABC transporter substrate-binding protein [Jiella flava]MBO0661969.1 zinc ABC transporter substrate-binding protein [Jiella flava]MCD2470704.1 zinc ABC transporter substrate-binding protein [Jiella flava]
MCLLSRDTFISGGLAPLAVFMMLVAPSAQAASPKTFSIVGVENEYANVAAQIGGRYVHVTAIESDPNTDPHSFEASPTIARDLARADLVIENGLGYDDWADKLLAATKSQDRKVIKVQTLLGLPDDTPNPHLWYKADTMLKVAMAVEKRLAEKMPAHQAVFEKNFAQFQAAMATWSGAISAFSKAHPNLPVAVTEPVADYLLQALGANIETPGALEMAAMNDTDPSPQDIAKENALFDGHKVKVFLYNQQVTDALTDNFLARAKKNGIPVVGVYETMPTPGFNYQSWMMAELAAIEAAVTKGQSTERLVAAK